VLCDLGLQTTRHTDWAYISLPEGAALSIEGKDVPAITHSMVPDTPEDGLQLPLVYVGKGGIAIPSKVQLAEEAGAAACVLAKAEEHVHEVIVSKYTRSRAASAGWTGRIWRRSRTAPGLLPPPGSA